MPKEVDHPLDFTHKHSILSYAACTWGDWCKLKEINPEMPVTDITTDTLIHRPSNQLGYIVKRQLQNGVVWEDWANEAPIDKPMPIFVESMFTCLTCATTRTYVHNETVTLEYCPVCGVKLKLSVYRKAVK